MKRTPRSKVASLYNFWAAQEQQQQQLQPQSSTAPRGTGDDVITLGDSPMEHLNIAPLSNAATQELPDKKVPSWAPLARHSTTSDPTPTPKYIPHPVGHISPASKAELEKAGFDPLEGSSIRYPANEYLRQFEIDIVKSCVSQNSAVCLPLAVSADHICAVVTANFLRWFPRCRVVSCLDSLDAAQMFQERCETIGIPPAEIFILDTFQTFKKYPLHEIGRVIVTTPQILEKIVETDSPLVSDIRCLIFYTDESLRITKYKNIVGTLIVKKILFRMILVTPSVPTTPRKLAPLRKRQQVITSLALSQWIEPPASDLSFRNNIVPLGLSADYIENVEVLSESRSFTEKWLETAAKVLSSIMCSTVTSSHLDNIPLMSDLLKRTVIHLESLNDLLPLPSTKPQDLFTIDWTQISAKAIALPDDAMQLVVNCMFLVESARNLIIHGPRVFYLYCVDLLGNAEKDSRAGNIALMILGDPILSKVYEKIQAKYSYKSDSVFDISSSKFSLNSHPKFLRLKNLVDKCPAPYSCLLLCENDYVSRVVCESLDAPQVRNALIRVMPQTGIPPALAKYYRLPSQCSGLYNRQSGDLVVVVSVNLPDFTNVVDTICSNHLNIVISMDRRSICALEGHTGRHVAILDIDCEKLRPTDGRLIKVADERAYRRSSLFGKGGAIERYNFCYELSRLQLPISDMELVQYIPAVERLRGIVGGGGTCRQGFELSSDEFSEYCDRLSSLPPVERGFYSKTRRFAILGESPNIAQQPFVYIAGSGPSGALSKRMKEYLKGGDIIKTRLKRQFQYNEDLIDKKSIEFYDNVIARLDHLLSI